MRKFIYIGMLAVTVGFMPIHLSAQPTDMPPEMLKALEEQIKQSSGSDAEVPKELMDLIQMMGEGAQVPPVDSNNVVPTRPSYSPPPDLNNVVPLRPSYPQSSEAEIEFESSDDKNLSLISVISTLNLKNMDILDVLTLLSKKSGINIVAGQNVQGRVTVFLKGVEVEGALKVIAEANNWAYIKEDGIIKVMTGSDFETKYGYKFGQKIETRVIELSHKAPADIVGILNQVKSPTGKVITSDKSNALILIDSPAKLDEIEAIIARIDIPIKTEVFELSYAKVEDLSGKVGEALTPSIGRMRFDVRSNAIIVSDTQVKLNEIAQMIRTFDRKDKEVLVEAKILQIVLSDDLKFGIDWSAIVRDHHLLTLTNDFDILQSTEKAGRLSIGTLSEDDYTATIEALQTIGETELLSAPSITAVNNQEAKMLVGTTEAYVTTTTTTPASGPVTTAESVNFIDVGVQLYVTPTIHNDDFITMKIKPEVSSVTSTVTTGNNNTIPIISTSEAETTVLVKNRVTIVIGGLIEDNTIITNKQIPVLGSLPVLGIFFRSTDHSETKTEIVIFLKPTIITGDVRERQVSLK